MSSIDVALAIACAAHANQVDKGGCPYILHPLRLMLRFHQENEQLVALMHDVVEDAQVSLDDLMAAGFGSNVICAIDCLTRRDGEDYEQFISRLAGNELARKIKIADIEDNLNLARLAEVGGDDLSRVVKYHRALQYLKRFPG